MIKVHNDGKEKSQSFETWDSTMNIHSRILKLTKGVVICECLVDEENKVFENRSLPRSLFEGLKKLKEDKLIILSIKVKAGSMRIDVIDGEGFVDFKLFQTEESWNNLERNFKNKSFFLND